MENTKIKNQTNSDNTELPASDVKMLPIEEMKKWYEKMTEFGKEILKLNIDYGLLEGSDKPALLKPGAEKIKKAFGLQVERMDCVREIFNIDKNYMDYTYKCVITSKNGLRLGICDGNANSKENKFRYIFKPSEKVPVKKDLDRMKIEGKGKWKKISDKWVWFERGENPDVLSLKNSIQKIAQKRAFVGAILMATGASEFFTQDIIIN
ncbi:MAG: hypothetical protein NTU73_05525 [Ignavibacteriae bacterium]|nr:hypothetical protein [Ignavibacteriota bacterium]